MKAIVQTAYGPPEQVLRPAEVKRPVPGKGEVLVRVAATGVNTPDWIAIAGEPRMLRRRSDLRAPGAIRGTDLVGVVEAIGADVTDLREGDRVFGSVWTSKITTTGTFAEYTVARADRVMRLPEAIDTVEAGAAVMSGLTALCAIRQTARARPGQKVLINGASGGVGTFAVQLAALEGAEVTAVCGPSNVDLVAELGAARVLDYTRGDFTSEAGHYDVVLDNVMNHPPRRVARALAEGGVLMPNSVGNSGGLLAGLPRMGRAALMGRLGRTDVRFVSTEHNREDLSVLAGLLESGGLKVVLDRTYGFEEIPKAVARMFSHRARGNIAVTVP